MSPYIQIQIWLLKIFWLQCLRPEQTWSDRDLAKRRILCQIPSHVITTSRSPPLPSLENHLNFPEPNVPHRRSFYLFLFQTRVTEPLGLGGSQRYTYADCGQRSRDINGVIWNYTKCLVNTNLVNTNFTNTHFQKVPIPHLTRTMKQKFLH